MLTGAVQPITSLQFLDASSLYNPALGAEWHWQPLANAVQLILSFLI